MPPSVVPVRYARMRSLGFAWFLNIVIAAAIGSAWLRTTPAGSGFLVHLYLAAALFSTVATLASLPALLLWIAGSVVPSRVLGWLQAAVWTAFQLAIFADTRIYALYRYHFNGMVWNLLTTPGGQETVELGPTVWTLLALGAVLLFALELAAWKLVFVRAPELAEGHPWRKRSQRIWVAGCASVVLLVLLEKGLYAASDLGRERRITALARHFPLYQRLTVKRIARDMFGMQLEERPSVALGGESLLMRYPIQAPKVTPEPGRRLPNVLVIVIDSLRADMLAEETMPEIERFSRTGRRFDDHLSGGNGTRFGVFSLTYGIHGSYWMPIYQEHTPPTLVTTLQGLGYDMKVLSSATMNFPEFRSTAWVTIEDKIEDALPGRTASDRDQELERRFDQFLKGRAERKASEPFFCFALLDSPHGNYSWPPEETRFEPYAERVDFLKLSSMPSKDDIERVFNSYRNAVYFCDGVAGRMLMALRNQGELDDTLVVVTGDHGEEFFENGYFGHTSNFAAEQVHVPFVLAGPGIPPGVEKRPTSHVDFVPTLMELLGADPAERGGYSHGVDLLDPPERRQRVIASWDEIALWVDGGILRIPLEGHRGFIEGYDYGWTRLSDEDRLIESQGSVVARVASECRSFLR